ncbi:DUF6276 family protein [Bradyrhizobium arachidis]|uniref:DUF6276 family protein n=1 Tax=Bradyrhizobium TaxID=374 RepID=UPI0038D2196F
MDRAYPLPRQIRTHWPDHGDVADLCQRCLQVQPRRQRQGGRQQHDFRKLDRDQPQHQRRVAGPRRRRELRSGGQHGRLQCQPRAEDERQQADGLVEGRQPVPRRQHLAVEVTTAQT